MTGPDPDRAPASRAEELESFVDQLTEKVANEREADAAPGNRSDRESAPTRGSADEPPD
jgi:hypothetical protein